MLTLTHEVLLVAAEPEQWNWGNTLSVAAIVITGIVAYVDWKRGQDAATRENDRDDWQKKVVEEQVEIQRQQAETQRKSYELSLDVHDWQRQQGHTPTTGVPPSEPQGDDVPEQPDEIEHARTVDEPSAESDDRTADATAFTVRFAYRDSAHTWGRIIATYNGPSYANDVMLYVWAGADGQRREFSAVDGMDYREADRLGAGESVHTAITFTFGSPTAEDLRYKVDWTDVSGQKRTQEGRVPLD